MSSQQYYQKLEKMDPRPGVNYSTTYYKQSEEQRKKLSDFFKAKCKEIGVLVKTHAEVEVWLFEQDKRFKRDKKSPAKNKYKTPAELITDIIGECDGTYKNGTKLKDFAVAPIERWNKLFAGTSYEVEMVEQYGIKPNSSKTFNILFDQGETK